MSQRQLEEHRQLRLKLCQKQNSYSLYFKKNTTDKIKLNTAKTIYSSLKTLGSQSSYVLNKQLHDLNETQSRIIYHYIDLVIK